MPQTIDIEGLGPVEFPSDATDDEILAFAKKSLAPPTGTYPTYDLPLPGSREWERRGLRLEQMQARSEVLPRLARLADRLPIPPGSEMASQKGSASFLTPVGGSGFMPTQPQPVPNPPAAMRTLSEATRTGLVDLPLGMAAEPTQWPVLGLTAVGGPLGQTLRKAIGLLYGSQMAGEAGGQLGEYSVTKEPETLGRAIGLGGMGSLLVGHGAARTLEPFSWTLARELSQAPLQGQPLSATVPQRQVGVLPSQIGEQFANPLARPGLRELTERALAERWPAVQQPQAESPAISQLFKEVFGSGVQPGGPATAAVERPGGGLPMGGQVSFASEAGGVPTARQAGQAVEPAKPTGESDVVATVRQIATSKDRVTLNELRQRLIAQEPGLGVARANVGDYLRLIENRLQEINKPEFVNTELERIRETLKTPLPTKPTVPKDVTVETRAPAALLKDKEPPKDIQPAIRDSDSGEVAAGAIHAEALENLEGSLGRMVREDAIQSGWLLPSGEFSLPDSIELRNAVAEQMARKGTVPTRTAERQLPFESDRVRYRVLDNQLSELEKMGETGSPYYTRLKTELEAIEQRYGGQEPPPPVTEKPREVVRLGPGQTGQGVSLPSGVGPGFMVHDAPINVATEGSLPPGRLPRLAMRLKDGRIIFDDGSKPLVIHPFLFDVAKARLGLKDADVESFGFVKSGRYRPGGDVQGRMEQGEPFSTARSELAENPPEPSPARQEYERGIEKGGPSAPRIRTDQGPVPTEGIPKEGSPEARGENLERERGGQEEPGGPQTEGGIRIPEPKGPPGTAAGFLLPGPELIRKASGFARSAKVAGQQLFNRAKNLLQPGEFEWYDKKGLKGFLATPKTPEEVAKWMTEKGPRVEVRTFGPGAFTKEQREYADLQHNWYDALPKTKRDLVDSAFDSIFGEVRPESFLKAGGFTDAEVIKAKRYSELSKVSEVHSGKMSNWSQVAPKTESEMPGYVEGLVRAADNKELYPGNTHTGGLSNVLGWFRGYMDTDPQGRKVFHVIEVQSDWAARARRTNEPRERFGDIRDTELQSARDKLNHPLLKDWERLVLKAAIDRARKNGAERIAVSDAETAMMVEGHDLGHYVTGEEQAPKSEEGIVEAKGMRLHYDQILPKLLRELTGERGERVELGENKMARSTEPTTYPTREAAEEVARSMGPFLGTERNVIQRGDGWQVLGAAEHPIRSNLIFPDSTGPSGKKVSITATSFGLSKVGQGDFSLFGSDKPSGGGIGVKAAQERSAQAGGETGAMSLEPFKAVGRAMGETAKAVGLGVRLYTEPIVERLAARGGPVAKYVGKEALKIVSQAKKYYGELTPTLDPAKKLAGQAYRGGTTWIRGITQVTPRAATSRAVGAIEGTIAVPAHAKRMVDAVKVANLEIGKLAEKAVDYFKATGKMQRIMTVYGVDVIRRGGGSAWDAWTEGLAAANGMPVEKVRDFFHHWKDEMDKPVFDVASMNRISQDFVRHFPKTITHIKPGLAWQEVLISDPFSYLENAAQRTSHAVAFREVYPAGSGALEATRKAVAKEMATDRGSSEFNNLIKALQGHPLDSFTARWNAPDTIPGGVARMAGTVIGGPIRAMVLTGNAIANFAETVVGGPAMFLGYRNVIPAMARAGTLWNQLEMSGARNKALQNHAFDPVSPVRSLTRQGSALLRAGFMEQTLNEFQEFTAAASARIVSERAQRGDLSTREKELLVGTMRAMGFDQRSAHSASRGNAELLGQFERRAAAFLTSGNIGMAERSRLGASRLFNELFWFHQYPQMALNQVEKVSRNWLESARAGDWAQVRANSELMGRLVGGRTLQGAITVGAFALAFEGFFGLRERTKEAKDEPGEFLSTAMVAAFGGPLYVTKRLIEQTADSSTLYKTAGSLVAPVSVAGELMDAAFGNGRYEGRTTNERIGMFVESKTPGLRALKTGMSLFGLSQSDPKLDSSLRAFYRWRRANLGYREEVTKGTPEEDKQFRAQMLRAVDALRNGKDWRTALFEAGDAKTVAQSLRGRTVLRTPQGAQLSDEQMSALRKHIGDDPVNMLASYDAMLRQVARELSDEKSTLTLDQPTGKLAVDAETAGQREAHVAKRLPMDVQRFLAEQRLEVPGYQPQLKGRGGPVLLEVPQAAELEKQVATQYERFVRPLMANKAFLRLDDETKKKVFSERMQRAREAAEATVRRAIPR